MLNEGLLFAGKYELIRRLGSGGFSEVWLALDTKARVQVAVKIYAATAKLDDDGLEIFRQEFALVFDLNHTNLLHPTYFDSWDGMPYLIMPLCKNGSASKYLAGTSGEVLITEDECWSMLHDVAAGLAYMHDKTPPLIHQDIKPDNILINDEGAFMITDFGISTKVRTTMATVQNVKAASGTMAYMAPERFSAKPKPLMASDVWSLGAMMYELMTGGYPPFGNHGGVMQLNGAQIPIIEENFSDQLKELIYWCMAKETWDRPSARKIEEITFKKMHGMDITPDLPQNASGNDAEQQRKKEEEERLRREEEERRRQEEERRRQEEEFRRQEEERRRQEEIRKRQEQQKKKKLGLWAGIAVVAVVLLILVIGALGSGGGGNEKAAETSNEPSVEQVAAQTAELIQKIDEAQGLLNKGLEVLNSRTKDNWLATDDGAVETSFVDALAAFKAAQTLPGYELAQDDVKSRVANGLSQTRDNLTTIKEGLEKKASEAVELGMADMATPFSDRAKTIGDLLK